jgi:hypothetical protein
MLHFDIDAAQLTAIGAELNATPRQVKAALSRALARTASALRVLSSRGLAKELDLKRVAALRKRLKSVRLRSQAGGVTLWYGLNDMPVSWFRGTPRQTGTGVTFRGQDFPGAFVGRSKYAKGKTAFKRAGKARLSIVEQLMPVEDKAVVFIEDQIFDRLETIFWPLFMRDLKARVSYNLGAK